MLILNLNILYLQLSSYFVVVLKAAFVSGQGDAWFCSACNRKQEVVKQVTFKILDRTKSLVTMKFIFEDGIVDCS